LQRLLAVQNKKIGPQTAFDLAVTSREANLSEK
jgi:hypothetical protein